MPVWVPELVVSAFLACMLAQHDHCKCALVTFLYNTGLTSYSCTWSPNSVAACHLQVSQLVDCGRAHDSVRTGPQSPDAARCAHLADAATVAAARRLEEHAAVSGDALECRCAIRYILGPLRLHTSSISITHEAWYASTNSSNTNTKVATANMLWGLVQVLLRCTRFVKASAALCWTA
jgi:hypothetical protein